MKVLKVDKVAFFLVILSTCDDVAFAHSSRGGEMFRWCHDKEETSVITLARYSSHPWLFLPLISFSLCLLLCLSCSTHILYPPIPLVAAKTLTDKLQGRRRKRNGRRETEVERGRDRRGGKCLAPQYIFFALCHVSYFRFHYPPLTHTCATLPCCFCIPRLAFSSTALQADQNSTCRCVTNVRTHTICSRKGFDHNSI